jgi:predicted CoA-binding protein
MDDTICRILREYKRIGVIGLSNKPWRPSNRVARYLIDHGYEVIPVNPELSEVLGMQSYPNLGSAPGPVEVVDIFRRAEHIPSIVDEAVEIGAKAVWMQSGLIDEGSAERARRAGLLVVMDRCIMVEHRLHLGAARPANESAGAK